MEGRMGVGWVDFAVVGESVNWNFDFEYTGFCN